MEEIELTIGELAVHWSEWPWLAAFDVQPISSVPSREPIEAIPITGLIVERRRGGWLYRAVRREAPPALLAEDGRVTLFADPRRTLDDPERDLAPLRAALECAGAHRNLVLLHAACVEVDGTAVAFTGPSGVGKSTRAQAWVEKLGAQFVSGDRPGLIYHAGGWTAGGMPWDGKEKIRRQENFPLRAILEVRRSPANMLRRLNRRQAARVLMGQCYLPMWDERAATAVVGSIRRVAETVPVFRLFCGPDADSAAWTYGQLFRENNCEEWEARSEMKIKEGFVLRNIVGEHIVMPVGENINKFEGALVLNDVSAFLWENLKAHIAKEDLLALLLAEFDVERDVAERDLDAFLDQLRAQNLLEEDRVD